MLSKILLVLGLVAVIYVPLIKTAGLCRCLCCANDTADCITLPGSPFVTSACGATCGTSCTQKFSFNCSNGSEWSLSIKCDRIANINSSFITTETFSSSTTPTPISLLPESTVTTTVNETATKPSTPWPMPTTTTITTIRQSDASFLRQTPSFIASLITFILMSTKIMY